MTKTKSMHEILRVEGLTKYFGREFTLGSKKLKGKVVKAVEDVSFSIKKGEIFGFLGPNGAGKTTTMRAIMNYLHIQKGSIKVFGLDHQKDTLEIRKRIGYLPGEVALYQNFTGKELIEYFGKFRPIDPQMLKKLLSIFTVNLSKKIGSLSTGNRQQAALIAVMASNPDLLILDEPIHGLDPLIAARLHKLLIELRNQGKTIFLSSHDLSEVQKICDRVGIIKEGRMIVIEKVEVLLGKSLQTMNIEFDDSTVLPEETDFREVLSVVNVQKTNESGKFLLKVKENLNDLLKFLTAYKVKRFTLTDSDLEEIFLYYY